MEYLKVKTLLPKDGTAIKVEVLKKAGEPVTDNYGNLKTPYDVKVGDKDLMRFDATENQVSKMNECGKNPFVIKRWDKDGKVGFNFLDPQDISAQSQNCEPNISSSQIEKKIETAKDDVQERIIKGMCFNNACNIYSGTDPKNVLGDVKMLSKKFYDEMGSWLRGDEERPPCPEEVVEQVAPLTISDGTPEDDLGLPF